MIITDGVGSVRKALQAYGLKRLLEEMTVKEFKTLTRKMKGSYHRILADNLALIPVSGKWEVLKQVRDALEKFEPVRLKNFET